MPVLFGAILFASPAWAWFAEGHEIVAVIAADDLTPAARSHVGQILGVPADAGSVEKAMAAASIRPDAEFREQDRATAPWHYIDICLQGSERDVLARCPHGNCVTTKIDEYASRLRDGNYDGAPPAISPFSSISSATSISRCIPRRMPIAAGRARWSTSRRRSRISISPRMMR